MPPNRTDMNVNFGDFSPFILVKWTMILFFFWTLFFAGEPDLGDALREMVDACSVRIRGAEQTKDVP